MRRRAALLMVTLLAVACAPAPTLDTKTEVVRIVMGGDVMLGRAVSAVVDRDPFSILSEVALRFEDADLAMVNLESTSSVSTVGPTRTPRWSPTSSLRQPRVPWRSPPAGSIRST